MGRDEEARQGLRDRADDPGPGHPRDGTDRALHREATWYHRALALQRATGSASWVLAKVRTGVPPMSLDVRHALADLKAAHKVPSPR